MLDTHHIETNWKEIHCKENNKLSIKYMPAVVIDKKEEEMFSFLFLSFVYLFVSFSAFQIHIVYGMMDIWMTAFCLELRLIA